MKLDIHLRQQAPPNNLPDKTQNKMFPSFRKVGRTNVHDRTSDGFRRGDDDIIVLGDLKRIERFLGGGLVEDADIDGLGDGVVDELAEEETVTAFFKDLHGFGGDGDACAYIWIAFEHLIKSRILKYMYNITFMQLLDSRR